MCLVSAALLLPLWAGAPAAAGETPKPIHLAIFLSKTCPHCELVERDSLARLADEHRCRILPRYYDVDDLDEYKRLVLLERRLSDTGNDLPVVVVGRQVLGGVKEIQAQLADLVVSLREGGSPPVAVPTLEEARAAFQPATSTSRRGGAIRLAYFDAPGCSACARAERILGLLQARHPNLEVRRFGSGTRQDQVLLEALCEATAVPPERRLLVPAVFIGNHALIQEEVEDAALDQLCARYASSGSPAVWEIPEAWRAAAETRLWQRSRGLSVAAVIAGGLVDGINPCAFATLVFFVCCLAGVARQRRPMTTSRQRRLIFLAGGGFTLGVFVAYFLMGVGLSEALRGLDFLPGVSRVVTWVIIGATAILGTLSLRDAARARRGHLRAMSLVLPERARLWINALIARRLRAGPVAVTALGLGLVISLVEFVCTGQIYLPLIRYMTSVAGTRLRGYGLLLLYNGAFVVPLVAVFVATYFGLSSERLQAAFRRHVAAGKLALGLFFFGLGALLLHLSLSRTI